MKGAFLQAKMYFYFGVIFLSVYFEIRKVMESKKLQRVCVDSLSQILSDACQGVNNIEPNQLYAALEYWDIQEITSGEIGLGALSAMAKSLAVTGCVPKCTTILVEAVNKEVNCGSCYHFEPNPAGCGGVGRCHCGLGSERSLPTNRHPAGYPLGLPLYPSAERQCLGFQSANAHNKLNGFPNGNAKAKK